MLWTLRPCYAIRRSTWQPCRRFHITAPRLQPRHVVGVGRSRPPLSDLRNHTADSDPKPRTEVEEQPMFYSYFGAPSIRNQCIVSAWIFFFCPLTTNVLIRQFAIFGSLLAFGVAARQTNVDTYQWTNRLTESSLNWVLGTLPTNEELRRARHIDLRNVCAL